jgi:hypothetical protein
MVKQNPGRTGKIIFLNGLMPERHGHFIRSLGRRYTLCGTRLAPFQDDPDLEVLPFSTDARNLSQEAALEVQRRLAADTRTLVESLEEDVVHSLIGPETGWQLDEAFIDEKLRPRVAQLLLTEAAFRRFAEENEVSLVISGSDYGSHARVIARVARQLDLPTLNLEHGFFFNHVTRERFKKEGSLPVFFTSEYANFDNRLETELIGGKLSRLPDQGTTFLDLGTPIDSVASQALPRSEALATLGLDGKKTQLVIIGSWNEARSVQKLVSAQLENIENYDGLLRTLAARDFRHHMQLTIKLHPADARPEVFGGVKAGLESMAAGYGLPAPLILGDKLPEVLSAADVVLAIGFSSVLYDAFLLGKPSVVYFLPSQISRHTEGWEHENTLPLKHRVTEAATGPEQSWDLVEEWLEPERRARFEEDSRSFSEQYGLRFRTVEEKTTAVLDWIKELLSARA